MLLWLQTTDRLNHVSNLQTLLKVEEQVRSSCFVLWLIRRVAGNRIWNFFITYIPYIYPVYTPYTVETVYTKNPNPPDQTPRGVIA